MKASLPFLERKGKTQRTLGRSIAYGTALFIFLCFSFSAAFSFHYDICQGVKQKRLVIAGYIKLCLLLTGGLGRVAGDAVKDDAIIAVPVAGAVDLFATRAGTEGWIVKIIWLLGFHGCFLHWIRSLSV